MTMNSGNNMRHRFTVPRKNGREPETKPNGVAQVAKRIPLEVLASLEGLLGKIKVAATPEIVNDLKLEYIKQIKPYDTRHYDGQQFYYYVGRMTKTVVGRLREIGVENLLDAPEI